MRDVIIVGLVGAGTLAMRALYLVGLGGVTLSERSERWLGHAKPAILAALVGGFLAGGEAGITPASGAGVALLESAGLDESLTDAGLIFGRDVHPATLAENFILAIAQHRHWSREAKL